MSIIKMDSFLITGANLSDRLKQVNTLLKDFNLLLNTPHPDLLVLESHLSVKIKQVRQIKQFLIRKAWQQIKIVVIPEAEKITLPGQNALLKTLEEPPANSKLFLTTPEINLILPTIVSRCQVIQLINKIQENDEVNKVFFRSLKQDMGERLINIEAYASNRNQALEFISQVIKILENNLRLKTNSLISQKKILAMLISAQKTYQYLKANVNVKLCLDNFVLSL